MYLLHLRATSGTITTVSFPSAFARSLAMIALSAQLFTMTTEDLAVAA